MKKLIWFCAFAVGALENLSAEELKIPTPADGPYVEKFKSRPRSGDDPFAGVVPSVSGEDDDERFGGYWVGERSAFGAEEYHGIRVFRVSKVGKGEEWEDRDHLVKIFNRLNEFQKGEYEAGKSAIGFEIVQSLDSGNYLAILKTPILLGESQVLSNDIVMLKGLEKVVADGDHVSRQAELAGEFYEYISIAGANKRVHVMQVVKKRIFHPFSQKGFVELVKSGAPVGVVVTTTEECSRCLGDGELGTRKRSEKCPDCEGDGKWNFHTFYNVVWGSKISVPKKDDDAGIDFLKQDLEAELDSNEESQGKELDSISEAEVEMPLEVMPEPVGEQLLNSVGLVGKWKFGGGHIIEILEGGKARGAPESPRIVNFQWWEVADKDKREYKMGKGQRGRGVHRVTISESGDMFTMTTPEKTSRWAKRIE